MSRWIGSEVRVHQPRDWAKGGMTACGSEPDWAGLAFLFPELTGLRTRSPDPRSDAFAPKETFSCAAQSTRWASR